MKTALIIRSDKDKPVLPDAISVGHFCTNVERDELYQRIYDANKTSTPGYWFSRIRDGQIVRLERGVFPVDVEINVLRCET